jgi:excisionase family DNA binding protein
MLGSRPSVSTFPAAFSLQPGSATAELVARIPAEQIPYAVASLLVRWWTECNVGRPADRSGAGAPDPGRLLSARELAGHLGVPESWVRSEQRAGRIPSVRLGKYVRFRRSEVDAVLAESAQSRSNYAGLDG